MDPRSDDIYNLLFVHLQVEYSDRDCPTKTTYLITGADDRYKHPGQLGQTFIAQIVKKIGWLEGGGGGPHSGPNNVHSLLHEKYFDRICLRQRIGEHASSLRIHYH